MEELSILRREELIAADAFVASNATVLGEVHLGELASVWFGAVLRGDVAVIRVGSRSNVQDNAVVHGDPGFPVSIGDRVTVGHGAIVHGCTVEDDCLIGMRSVVMNGAVIGRGSVVGVGAVVTEGMVVPPGSVVLGVPAKVRGECGEEHAAMIRRGAEHYSAAGTRYRLG